MDSLGKQPRLRNMDIRFGTWNIRSLYRAGSFLTVLKGLSNYVRFSEVQEARWDRGAGEYTIYNEICVVRVPGYRSRGLGSTPGATRFLRSSGSRTGSTQPREYN
jgi:hypothetical protein